MEYASDHLCDVSAPFDPCLIAGLTSSATEFQRLQMLARGSGMLQWLPDRVTMIR